MGKLSAPFVRAEGSSRQMTLDVLLAAIPLCIFSAINYGMRPVIIVLLSMLAAIISEAICCLFRKKSLNALLDGSAAVTGAIIGLVMSPMVSYWVPMLGAAFAIIVVKAPFGGYGRNLFNPAAAGIAVLTYCFPRRLFTYPILSDIGRLPLHMAIDQQTVAESSLAAQLRAGATPNISKMQLLMGNFSGPIGATAVLILLACALFLLFRRSAAPSLMISYFVTCLIIAWLFPCNGIDRLYGTFAQLSAGYVLFTGVFLLNDPVTTPRFWLGRILFGICTAILVMLLQHIGRAEAGSCFAILLMDTLAPMIDRWSWHMWHGVTQLFRIRREVKAHE